jgi:hypothetical protein
MSRDVLHALDLQACVRCETSREGGRSLRMQPNRCSEPSEYATKEYVEAPLTEAVVERVERALGFKLPDAYVALMQHQNGGIPRRTCHRTGEPTRWATDHVVVHGMPLSLSFGSTACDPDQAPATTGVVLFLERCSSRKARVSRLSRSEMTAMYTAASS